MTTNAYRTPRSILIFLLAGQFNFALPVATMGQIDMTCKPPSAVRELNVESFYVDEKHSIVDSQRLEKNLEGLYPIRDFMRIVSSHADKYIATDDLAIRDCAIKILRGWADARALSETDEKRQNIYELNRVTLSLAIVVSKLSPERADRDSIVAWLTGLFDKVDQFYFSDKGPRNNLFYWHGAASSALYNVTHEERFSKSSSKVLQYAASKISPTGDLDDEEARGARSKIYMLHAFNAIALTKEALRRAGVSLPSLFDKRFDILRLNVLELMCGTSTLPGVQEAPDKTTIQTALALGLSRGESACEHIPPIDDGAADPNLGGNLHLWLEEHR